MSVCRSVIFSGVLILTSSSTNTSDDFVFQGSSLNDCDITRPAMASYGQLFLLRQQMVDRTSWGDAKSQEIY